MAVRRPSRLLAIGPADTLALLDLDTALIAAETAFRAHADGTGRVFPLVRERIGGDSVFGIKSGVWSEAGLIGLKTGGYWPANLAAGWDRHQAAMLLIEQVSGRPIGLLDGNAITRQQTAAAGALAVKILAGADAEDALVVGAGVQGEAQAEALATVMPRLRRLAIWSRRPEQAQTVADRLQAKHIPAAAVSELGIEVQRAGVIATTTGAQEPLILDEWVRPGAHLNAMGADTIGKHEIATALLLRATLVADDWAQARRIGESQHLPESTEPRPSLGEVLLGTRPGRPHANAITVFDSTGIALQDIVAAVLVYRRAVDDGIGTYLDW